MRPSAALRKCETFPEHRRACPEPHRRVRFSGGLAQPIVPPVDGRLTMLGLVAAATTHSGGGYLSLHADEDNQPGR